VVVDFDKRMWEDKMNSLVGTLMVEDVVVD